MFKLKIQPTKVADVQILSEFVLQATPDGATPGLTAPWLDFLGGKGNNNGAGEVGVVPYGVPSRAMRTK